MLKETLVFSSEFFEIFESTGFTEHFLTTSSILRCTCGYILIIVVETKNFKNIQIGLPCASLKTHTKGFSLAKMKTHLKTHA